MNKFTVGACTGVLSLAVSQYTTARTAPVGPAAKKAPAKKKVTKGAEPVTAAKPEGVQWRCGLGSGLYIAGDITRDQIIKLHWKDKNYDLPRQLTRTGAGRYFDQKIGFDLVVIPAKAMLFDRNKDHHLANECQTTETATGVPAPTQADALHAPVGLPLMILSNPTPAPAPAPGTAQPAQQ